MTWTASAPAMAARMDRVSSRSATATSDPKPKSAPLTASRATARTGMPCWRSLVIVARPILPVAPRTAITSYAARLTKRSSADRARACHSSFRSPGRRRTSCSIPSSVLRRSQSPSSLMVNRPTGAYHIQCSMGPQVFNNISTSVWTRILGGGNAKLSPMPTLTRFGALLFALSSTTAAAQTIQGTVTTGGSPVVGATVRLLELDRTDRTNSRGEFRFLDVPRGTYRVYVGVTGYLAATDTVQLSGPTASLKFTLSRSAFPLEEIVVSASPTPRPSGEEYQPTE